ncbi:MAG: hypothetical protein MUC68_18805 [Burkholderiaceae bacterium]|nr:hypothetical protein [Burkholderiaceae bacterium]
MASGSTAGLTIATLERLLRRSTDTGAVTLRVGEVYFGPGQMTVGWLGAKTQIVLPRGGWVVLSATDHDSDHRPAIRMTTLYFGRFERGQIKALLRYTFNSRTPAEPREQRWTAVDDCLGQARPDTDIWPGRRASSRQCNAIDPADAAPITAAPQYAALKASLDAIEMALPESVAARARFSHTDLRSNFLQIERVEFGVAVNRPARWRDWSREYASLALQGFDRQLALDELEPNLLNPRTDTRCYQRLPCSLAGDSVVRGSLLACGRPPAWHGHEQTQQRHTPPAARCCRSCDRAARDGGPRHTAARDGGPRHTAGPHGRRYALRRSRSATKQHRGRRVDRYGPNSNAASACAHA